ncbi:MAG TPA: PQQ-like beta-propeller repeat protein [Verrucomicrobiota bacterium]|jgi:outer membrane protein assembly factor BamB|nr:PQQ-like beta-propeller repeat protein [Verrucomicrobiota bacterium]HQL79259.1 PQQ-like beta-propeller repeat protein [Verrucomicrobiota bacterium]
MRLFSATVFLAWAAFGVFTASGSDWPRWRGPDLNGISTERGWQAQWPAAGPKQLWQAAVGTGFSSFSVSRGRVYTMGNTSDTDWVFCLDANTGKALWKHSYACPLAPESFEGGPCATPTVADGHVYTFSRQGHVFCLDAKTGAVAWSRNLNQELGLAIPRWGCAGSVLIEGNLAVLNMGSAGVALDKQSGKVVWVSDKSAGAYATPVPLKLDGDRCLLIFSRQSLIAVNAATGGQRWSYPWKTSYDVNAADPIVAGDKVFICSGYNHGGALLKVSARAAEAVWENKNMRNHFNTCVLWRGHLYGPDDSGLRCVAFDTGELKWAYGQFGKGSLVVADDKLVALSDKGELIIAEAVPAAFRPISRAQVLKGKCWTTPVLANGHIYCRNAVGDVVCLDVSGR